MREAWALQKILTFFQQKNIGIFEILTFEILTSRFEQPGPGIIRPRSDYYFGQSLRWLEARKRNLCN